MENEKKKKIELLNPCKHCLKRPMCSSDCHDFKCYETTQEWIVFCILLIIFMTIVAAITVSIFYIEFSNTIKAILVSLTFIGIYIFYTKKMIEESSDEFLNLNSFMKMLIIITNPWGDMLNEILDKIKIVNFLEKYIRRYRKN